MYSQRAAYAPPLDPYDYAPERPPGDSRRGLMLLAVSAGVLLALGGAIWSSYNQGVRVGGRAAPPRIAAPSEPYKVAPEDPGGATTDHLGVRVFDVLESPPATYEDEETPALLREPAAPVVEAVEPPAESVVFLTEEEPRLSITVDDVDPDWVSEPYAPPPGLEPADAPEALEPAPPAPAAAVAPAREPEPASSTAAATGSGYLVQVASYRTEESAGYGWSDFRRTHGDLLAGLEHSIVRKDLSSGAWYRLYMSGFASRNEAAAFCEKLKSRGQDCLVTAP